MPENYDEIVGEAIQLKREVPRSSVRQIIKILETEGYALPGVIRASTLQRNLYKAGLGTKQMKRYTEKRETTSRRFCRGDSKRQLQKEIANIRTVQKKKVIFVLDEAHLLGKETLEEFRFLLNYKFDSSSPMSLILVGQTELWEQKLRLQSYAAIRQRIDMNIVLNHLDRAETGKYIAAHMAYAGVKKDLSFTVYYQLFESFMDSCWYE